MVIPKFISLIDWADNLFIDYPKENLPILLFEDNWEEWGEILVGTGQFLERACPSPLVTADAEKKRVYDDWIQWADQIYMIMSTPVLKQKEEKEL